MPRSRILTRFSRQIVICGAVFCFGTLSSTEAAEHQGFMLQLELNGQEIEGTPLSWSKSQVYLLARDGRLWDFRPQEAKKFHRTNNTFESYSAAHIRSQLTRELGRGFEITGTGHYLVAHPRGQGKLWSQRFEDLYRSFVHFFGVRGFRLDQPEFPLVAIVWPTQSDFYRYARSEGSELPPNVLGYYSPISNRITLYDTGAGSSNPEAWKLNAETIIHEATHQTAFNTGIHRRFGNTPKWVVEGLGTLFEAPGVWNSSMYKKRTDRINNGRLVGFKNYVNTNRKVGSLAEFISSDRLFFTNVSAAYAEAWALTYYLIESRPRKFAEYLRLTTQREPFEDYTSQQRLSDFTAVFGTDLRLLEAQFVREIEGLR